MGRLTIAEVMSGNLQRAMCGRLAVQLFMFHSKCRRAPRYTAGTQALTEYGDVTGGNVVSYNINIDIQFQKRISLAHAAAGS
jgi:predicted class III extradiol MEMO1 family dioxygenase